MLERRTHYSRVDGTRCVPVYQSISINIEKCYQTIIDDSWNSLEANRTMTPQETFMRFRRDPQFLQSFNRKNRITTCSPSRRKNLSSARLASWYDLTAPIAIIVIIMVLDSLVSNYLLTF